MDFKPFEDAEPELDEMRSAVKRFPFSHLRINETFKEMKSVNSRRSLTFV